MLQCSWWTLCVLCCDTCRFKAWVLLHACRKKVGPHTSCHRSVAWWWCSTSFSFSLFPFPFFPFSLLLSLPFFLFTLSLEITLVGVLTGNCVVSDSQREHLRNHTWANQHGNSKSKHSELANQRQTLYYLTERKRWRPMWSHALYWRLHPRLNLICFSWRNTFPSGARNRVVVKTVISGFFFKVVFCLISRDLCPSMEE